MWNEIYSFSFHEYLFPEAKYIFRGMKYSCENRSGESGIVFTGMRFIEMYFPKPEIMLAGNRNLKHFFGKTFQWILFRECLRIYIQGILFRECPGIYIQWINVQGMLFLEYKNTFHSGKSGFQKRFSSGAKLLLVSLKSSPSSSVRTYTIYK